MKKNSKPSVSEEAVIFLYRYSLSASEWCCSDPDINFSYLYTYYCNFVLTIDSSRSPKATSISGPRATWTKRIYAESFFLTYRFYILMLFDFVFDLQNTQNNVVNLNDV